MQNFLYRFLLTECSLPKKVGNCKAAMRRFFYDAAAGQCKPFTYGGCDENANNFNTIEECNQRCSRVLGRWAGWRGGLNMAQQSHRLILVIPTLVTSMQNFIKIGQKLWLFQRGVGWLGWSKFWEKISIIRPHTKFQPSSSKRPKVIPSWKTKGGHPTSTLELIVRDRIVNSVIDKK